MSPEPNASEPGKPGNGTAGSPSGSTGPTRPGDGAPDNGDMAPALSPQPPPGAQRERTQLSWRRTLVSFSAVALLLGRLAAVHLDPTTAALALAAVALVWAAAVRLIMRRVRNVATPVGRSLAGLVGLILLYCAMATLLLMP
ncbi:DUF202 domain-containing protein [Dactylosporangium sp. NPDC051485]|uniref:DUF202 domain-containing protein n=1 Tax=Dactylosporangium sp. NPDC051485 TaxID=3154846 RepID=UPI00343FA74E